jgi:formylglycine-generating enzyme
MNQIALRVAFALPALAALVCHVSPLSASETKTNSIGMKLVLVPAGEFTMGAEEDPSDTLSAFPYARREWLDGETPAHRVRITKPFYLGAHEVTYGQFLTFYHAAKYKTECERDGKPSWGYDSKGKLIESRNFRFWNAGWKQTFSHPVVYVSWNDATAFCRWLSKKEGKQYRLPTESEWEYACRAGTETRYSCGNNPEDLVRVGNVADQDNRVAHPGWSNATIAVIKSDKQENTNIPFPYLSSRDGYGFTAPVGKFRSNAFGLYDMHGNVWEWCSDWYDEGYYSRSPTDDPPGPNAGSSRVLRGGGWNVTPVGYRSASRCGNVPADRGYLIGFRVVCERE